MKNETKLKSYLESKYNHLELIPYEYLEEELLCTKLEAIAYSLDKTKRGMIEKEIFIQIIIDILE